MAPSTGIEPASNCSTGSRPHQRTSRARERAWWWCAGEDSHLHSRRATGLQAAGLASARAGARPPRLFGLPCLFGFQCAGPGFSGQKEKGPGVARPLSAPCLVEETPGPVTLGWIAAQGQMSLPPTSAGAGDHSRHFGCGFPIRRPSAYDTHGNVRIYRVLTHCQAANLTMYRIDALPTRQVCLSPRAKHRFHEPCRAGHRSGRGEA
jgi:hypothetical protein